MIKYLKIKVSKETIEAAKATGYLTGKDLQYCLIYTFNKTNPFGLLITDNREIFQLFSMEEFEPVALANEHEFFKAKNEISADATIIGNVSLL